MIKKTLFLLSGMIGYTTAFSQLPLGIQGTSTTICQGSSATLYAVGGLAGRTWQPGGATSQFITVNPTTTTMYVLTSGTSTANYMVQVCEDANCQMMNTVTFHPLLLSTGNNGLTSVLSAGQNDLNWTYSTTLHGTYIPAVVSDNSYIPGNYSRSNWPNAQWVGVNENLFTVSNTYYYRLQFALTAAQALDLSLSMQFMADNMVMGVSVNDVLVPNSTTPGLTDYGFQLANASSVTMQGSWIAGLNTITVQVKDEGGYSAFVAQLNPVLSIPVQTIICTTLPIKFLSIEAEPLSDAINLTWNVAMDHMDHFVIEHSENGMEFDPIGNLNIPYNQNSIISTYTFTDKQALNGINYYRVVAYETSGDVSYSSICVVRKTGTYNLQVFPNPGKGVFTFSGTLPLAGKNYLHIFNATGQLVYTFVLENEKEQFERSMDLTHLPSGIYAAQLDNGLSMVKFIIE